MKFIMAASLTLGLSLSAQAQVTPSQSQDQFCADRADTKFVKTLTTDSSNLMTFRNHGGLGNGGVCWWHSRFQRNALYLTIYKPGEDYPSLEEAAIIVDKIRAGKEIITIRGFKNFSEFSAAHENLIQRELEKWQKKDGIVKFNWIMGLKGKKSVSADKLKSMMDELYDYVEVRGNIAYQKLQMKGITAHAWLVINMKKVPGGYDLEVIDSNTPYQTTAYNYRSGMKSFNHWMFGEFVPYTERSKELNKVKNAMLKKCDPSKYKVENENDEEKSE